VSALGAELAFLRVVMKSECKVSSSTQDLRTFKGVYLVNIGALGRGGLHVIFVCGVLVLLIFMYVFCPNFVLAQASLKQIIDKAKCMNIICV